MNTTAEIMDRGMNCLIEKMGIIEAEQFISIIIREKFDYTRWKQKYFDNVDLKEFNSSAALFDKQNPLT